MRRGNVSAGTDAARDLVVVRFAFGSFAKVCLLISAHVGALVAIAFFLTNGGRRVSFGTSQYFGTPADLVGSLFLLVALALFIALAAMLAYVPIHALLRLTGGMRLRATTKGSAPGDGPSP